MPAAGVRPSTREVLRWGAWSGAVWSIGNTLTTGPFLVAILLHLGVRGFDLSLVLALPALSGLARALAPWLLTAAGNSKRLTLIAACLAYPVLALVPVIVSRHGIWPQRQVLVWLLAALALHQMLEYLSQVALWTWMAEWVPPRIRGRYFGTRLRWQLLVQPVAIVLSELTVRGWQAWQSGHGPAAIFGQAAATGALSTTTATAGSLDMTSKLLPFVMGVAFLLAFPLTLLRLPAGRTIRGPAPQERNGGRNKADERTSQRGAAWRAWRHVLRDRAFRPWLLFGVISSLGNGLGQSAQNQLPFQVLGMRANQLAWLRTFSQVGQAWLARPLGKFAERQGQRPVIMGCQAVVALGPLYYAISQWSSWPLLLVAWAAWCFYAGINAGIPDLLLKFGRQRSVALPDHSPMMPTGKAIGGASPGPEDVSVRPAAYIGLYQAGSAIAYAAGTLGAGWALDQLQSTGWHVDFLTRTWTGLHLFLVLSFLGRLLATVPLLMAKEPGKPS